MDQREHTEQLRRYNDNAATAETMESLARNNFNLRCSIHAAHGLLAPLGNQVNPSVMAIREALDILRRAMI